MKQTLRTVFQPILKPFESGEGEYRYDQSRRTILLAVGALFLILSGVSSFLVLSSSQWGGLVPVVVFFLIGLVCEVVGFLGTDRAVAKMWGSK